jgi:hypothetical protein
MGRVPFELCFIINNPPRKFKMLLINNTRGAGRGPFLSTGSSGRADRVEAERSGRSRPGRHASDNS